MKPKINRAGIATRSSNYDQCQTPGYALDPLLPYIPKDWFVWDSAAGEGNLAKTLRYYGYGVVKSDILTGTNFFDIGKDAKFDGLGPDAIVTNPPYSIKYQWLAHCYELGKPFALLMPVEMLGAARAQRAFQKYGIQLILMDRRVNFKMPQKGSWRDSAAQFPVAWYTWMLKLPSEINYAHLDYHYYPWEQDEIRQHEEDEILYKQEKEEFMRDLSLFVEEQE